MSILFRSSSPSDSIYATDSLQEDPKKEESEDSSSGLLSDSVGSCSSASETSLSSSTTPSIAKEKYAILPDIDSPTTLFDNPGVTNLIEKDDDSSKIRNSSQGSNDISGLSEVKSSTPDPFTTLYPVSYQSHVDIGFLEGEKNIPKQSVKDFVGSSNAYCAVNATNAVSNSLECLITELANSNCESFSKDKGFSHPSTLTRSPSKKTVTKSEFSKDQFPQNDFVGKTIWESKNPFNPFLAEDPPGIPLHQNLPFPRPGSKISECLSQMPLTPQLPNHADHGLPPPLPERKKPPRFSTQSTFDLNTVPLPPPLQLQQDPNLPLSFRKLPPIKELVDSRKVSSQGMVGQERRPDLADVFRHHQGQMGEFSKDPESCEKPPPLPPKRDSRKRQSPMKSKQSSAASCDSGSSKSSSAEFSKGSQSSSSSELHSSDYSAFGSSSEALFSNSPSNQSEVFPHISRPLNSPPMISKPNEDQSPDSIFRRRSDPFDDEFFLNLRKPLQKLEK